MALEKYGTESLRFENWFAQAADAKQKTRPPKAELQDLRSALWALNLLEHFDADPGLLDRTLVVRNDSTRPFAFNKWPPPLTKQASRKYFVRVLRGSDPAGNFCQDAEGKFSLADRVASHWPDSRAWLFEPLAPYLESDCPPIGYALSVLPSLLEATGLQALKVHACEAVVSGEFGEADDISLSQLRFLATVPTPSHLSLLIALAHLRSWADPRSDTTKTVLDVVGKGFDVIAALPMGRRHPDPDALRSLIMKASRHIAGSIWRNGDRSVGRGPGLPQKKFPLLLCRPFPGLRDAEYCAGLHVAIPFDHFVGPTRSKYFSTHLPSTEELAAAVADLRTHMALKI